MTEPRPAASAAPADAEMAEQLPFGPYAGQRVDLLAVVDPRYLLDLVREGIGSHRLRAAAARALARREQLGPPSTISTTAAPQPAEGSVSPAAPIVLGSRRPSEPVATWPGAARPARSRRLLAAARRMPPWLVGGLIGLALLALVGLASRAGSPRPGSGFAPAGQPGSGATWTGPIESPKREAPGVTAGATPRDDTARSEPAAPDAPAFDASAPCGARVAGAIPAESAADFLDTFQAVEFEVTATKDTGRVTFLNSHDPYPGHFYVAIFPDDYAAFPEHPARHFRDRCVVIQGSIESYRGTAQIVLRDPGDIRILDAAPETPERDG